MLYIWAIENIIKDTLQEHHLNLSYEIDNNLPAPMSFNVSTNTIKFDYLKINGHKAKVNNRLKETDENFVKIMLYHEIGYYLDFKKNKHDLKTLKYGEDWEIKSLMNLIEKNAWDFGRTLVPDDLLDSYDKYREIENQRS
ncbi:hypothetical protein [Jeotgalibacillus proteolyticus]|uniref:IrrE N-terminal-like domain-containing protein n=1 Tax=Jeotgalibacillus proteolyticus TaxID=2082395 RepID=A0A2S5G7P8_9BACL|nr:hypothetical protein [Jeotgalibacillus proteolyticus]PPA69006.1 hypothetical protein C4B60_18780 [Jeotgalibacillus proteolyticus]